MSVLSKCSPESTGSCDPKIAQTCSPVVEVLEPVVQGQKKCNTLAQSNGSETDQRNSTATTGGDNDRVTL